LDLKKEYHHREVTMSREDKNQKGKRVTKTKLTGKKARKLSKKRDKIEKLQKVPEETSQKEKSQELSFVGISEPRHMALRRGKEIQLLDRYTRSNSTPNGQKRIKGSPLDRWTMP
jgi:hypothetical protein